MNQTVDLINNQLTLSRGGLDDITTVVKKSYVYLNSELSSNPKTSLGFLIEDLFECRQVEMVDDRGKYVVALQLSPTVNDLDFGPLSVKNAAFSCLQSLGLKKGLALSSEESFLVEFGDLSPDEFRYNILNNGRQRLQWLLDKSTESETNSDKLFEDEKNPFYDRYHYLREAFLASMDEINKLESSINLL
jgi:hypothetical protein